MNTVCYRSLCMRIDILMYSENLEHTNVKSSIYRILEMCSVCCM